MNKLSKLFFAAGTVLLYFAILWSVVNVTSMYRAASAVETVMEQMPRQKKSDSTVKIFEVNPDIEMPCKEIDGRLYIGTLQIPSLSLNLPVAKDCNYNNMSASPCCYSGSVYKNNMVIAGHNYPAHLKELKEIQPDADVIFTDIDGNEFRYKVDYTDILGAYDTEEMTSGDWDLTVFTCTRSGQERVTVRCSSAK